MGGSTNELTGPDLENGVALADLPDGGQLIGHADGEAVLVLRRGDEIFATGATCTHYGGPLAEGLVVGDTVRCPWHHACFSLRNGEAIAAPALNAIPCWDVEVRGETLVVLGKKKRGEGRPGGNEPSHAAVATPSTVERVVVVGAGAAGNAAVEMLRREGFAGSITLLGDEPEVPCDRPNLSKDYLAGTAPEEWIPLRGRELYAEWGIALELGARVAKIDVAAKSVSLADGRAFGFDALVLATGAAANRLTIPGAELPHVHTLRTLGDSRAIIARAKSAKRAVVVGASFIGLEVAASLRTRGLEVHVVAPEERPLERVLGPQLGAAIRAIHEAHGVVFHLGDVPSSIDATKVTLKSGATIDADLVVAGVGVRPNLALAEAAGLAIDRGVLVDAQLRTSAPHVYAVGDVARYPDPRTGERIRVEHWVVAERMGQLAARNVLGHGLSFDAVPFFWSQHYDVPIAYVGHATAWDRIDVVGDPSAHDCAIAYRRAGKTLAVATIGRDRASLEAELAIERGDEARLREIVPGT